MSPFPNLEEGRWLVSQGGGRNPLWARDARALFYLTAPGRLMSVAVELEPAFNHGNPEVVVDGPYLAPLELRPYDVSADGQQFLMIGRAAARGPTLIVVEGWLEELRQRVPAGR